MKQFKAKIISNKKITHDHYILSFRVPRIAKKVNPGQFFNIRVSNSYQPILRRPFSVHKISRDRIEILYKVVGEGTRILSTKKNRDVLDIIGPLGNGFEIEPSAISHQPSAILVAGGHGIAPLYALANQLSAINYQLSVYIGARTEKHIVCKKEFKKLGAKVYIATEDGSRGYKGLVTNLLKHNIRRTMECGAKRSLPEGGEGRLSAEAKHDKYLAKAERTMYACGPKDMLKEVAGLSTRYKIPCQVSLEEYMACGIGTCLGCAVKTRSGYKLVCRDGPVFDAREIVW